MPVVQKMMKTEMRTKEALGCSLSTAEMATPSTHMIVTLYTDIPTYLHRGVWSNITPRKVPYRYRYRDTETSCYEYVKWAERKIEPTLSRSEQESEHYGSPRPERLQTTEIIIFVSRTITI